MQLPHVFPRTGSGPAWWLPGLFMSSTLQPAADAGDVALVLLFDSVEGLIGPNIEPEWQRVHRSQQSSMGEPPARYHTEQWVGRLLSKWVMSCGEQPVSCDLRFHALIFLVCILHMVHLLYALYDWRIFFLHCCKCCMSNGVVPSYKHLSEWTVTPPPIVWQAGVWGGAELVLIDSLGYRFVGWRQQGTD